MMYVLLLCTLQYMKCQSNNDSIGLYYKRGPWRDGGKINASWTWRLEYCTCTLYLYGTQHHNTLITSIPYHGNASNNISHPSPCQSIVNIDSFLNVTGKGLQIELDSGKSLHGI
jgi:hypothetical protein